MIKACICDLDGTLLNTLSALYKSVAMTMEGYGYGPVDMDHIKQFVGEGAGKLIERSLAYHHDDGKHDLGEACARYNEIFKTHCSDGVMAYEGMADAMRQLKARGIKLAVLSNKSQDRAEDNIYTYYGRDLFDLIYGEREGVPRKPDPTPLTMTMQELGVTPQETLYLGDTKTDMITGKSAGAITVGVLWGFRDRQELVDHHADYIINKPDEIIGLIDNQQTNQQPYNQQQYNQQPYNQQSYNQQPYVQQQYSQYTTYQQNGQSQYNTASYTSQMRTPGDNDTATAALITGIVSLLADFFCCIGFPIAIAGIVLAMLSREDGIMSSKARAGFIMSIIALVLPIIFIILYVFLIIIMES